MPYLPGQTISLRRTIVCGDKGVLWNGSGNLLGARLPSHAVVMVITSSDLLAERNREGDQPDPSWTKVDMAVHIFNLSIYGKMGCIERRLTKSSWDS